jgi:glycosyltransferase involved in cell wall biosynthesis
VTETYPPEINGVAHTLAHLAAGLRAMGHRVSLVRPRPRTGNVRDLEADTTVVAGLPLPGYPTLRLGLPAARALRRAWSADRPHAVYAATEGPLGWSAGAVARRLGIPLLSGFHTNFQAYVGHYGAPWLEPVLLRYLRRFHNRTLGTLVATADLRDRLGALGFRNVSVLGRGVDRDLFSPARRSEALRRAWGAGGDDPVVIHVGRLAPEKNIGLAIAAYRALQQTCAAARFAVVGDGPARAALQAAHPDLIFCGAQTGEALAAHYASGDVFLFPSETETFGNVTLEAMASGLAVVAFDYAAARAHIRPGWSGVLVPRGDARAFVERAADLARSPDAVRALGRQAREDVAAVDWAHVVRRLERMLGDFPSRGSPLTAPVGARAVLWKGDGSW